MFTWDRAAAKLMPILPLLSAADAMPQTLILNKQGVMTYNAQAPQNFEKLEALYLRANEG